jgi:rhodanese-related sulfurtransferase
VRFLFDGAEAQDFETGPPQGRGPGRARRQFVRGLLIAGFHYARKDYTTMKTLDIARPLLGVALLSVTIAPAAFGQEAKPAVAPTSTTVMTSTVQAEARRIEVPEVQAQLTAGKKIVFVDGRGKASGKIIKGAVHVPYDNVETWAKDVPKDTVVVAYCACSSEQTSLAIVRKLQELGFTNAYALKGGIHAWTAASLPSDEAPVGW